jgi:hypothetical protein
MWQSVRIMPVLSASELAQISGTPPLIATAAALVTTLERFRSCKGRAAFARAK